MFIIAYKITTHVGALRHTRARIYNIFFDILVYSQFVTLYFATFAPVLFVIL